MEVEVAIPNLILHRVKEILTKLNLLSVSIKETIP
jgi:hypothetical protein